MKLLLIILGVLLLLPAALGAQTSKEKEREQQRQKARALGLIEQVGTEAELWDDKKSAVEALAIAADLLWDRNPARARKWLARAWEFIDQVPESDQNPALKEFVVQSDKTPLKSIVLRVANQHDPKLAEKFLEQLAQQQPEAKKERGAFDDRTPRSEQLLSLAQQALQSDPQLAFRLAQQSLSDGLSFKLQNILTGLRQKNAGMANQLFDLALQRFTVGPTDPSEAEVLAGYLFQPGMTFSSSSTGQVIMSMNPQFRDEPPVANSEPERARKFLLAAYQIFFTQPLALEAPEQRQYAQKIWVFGNRSLSRYQSITPEFAVPLKSYLTQLESKLFPAGRGDPFANSRRESGAKPPSEKDLYEARLTALEERAENAPDAKTRDRAYVDAALATNSEDYLRAKSLVEKIADETLQTDAVSYVFYRAALGFVRGDQIEKAIELIPQIEKPARRALVKIALAQSFLADKAAAEVDADEKKLRQQKGFDVLDEVERELRKEEPSAEISKILLARAALISRLDNDQGLVALEQSLRSLNQLDRFDLKNFLPPRLGIKGSWRSESLANVPRVGFDFRSAIDRLISTEFENLLNLTDNLKVREVRGLARLEIARLYLEKLSASRPPAAGR